MKILWFTNTPSLYDQGKHHYHGGGWIESLELLLKTETDISHGVSFFHKSDEKKTIIGDTIYYPLLRKSSKERPINAILTKLKPSDYSVSIKKFIEIIDDFKPDVIHIFGSEECFGLIAKYTEIPVIIHIQGLLNPYFNAYFPPGLGVFDLFLRNIINPYQFLLLLNSLKAFKNNAQRERIILSSVKNFMGRTDWDKQLVKLQSPNSTYYYCSEILRDDFYTEVSWQIKSRKKIILCSTISDVMYKGYDLILKTAQLLKESSDLDFDWIIFGISPNNKLEKYFKIKYNNVNVFPQGAVDAKVLVDNLLNCDIFIHPSYIDNSPNSICEAQILGVPIISTYVGGIPSLIENNITGTLIPSNDPYYLAANIARYSENKEEFGTMATAAQAIAKNRHNKYVILEELKNIYKDLKINTI